MKKKTRVEPSTLTAEIADGVLALHVAGRLDANTIGTLWRQGTAHLAAPGATRVVLDAREVSYCDTAGAAWLVELRKAQTKRGGEFAIEGLAPDLERVVNLLTDATAKSTPAATPSRASLPVQLGRGATAVTEEFWSAVSFVGELTIALGASVIRPARIRWSEVVRTVDQAGANALLLIAMIGVLFGLILAFQSAIPLQRFGAEIYIADLVSISMVRELAAILTAIVLAGRSGSAFAAEIGTMKVNEEIDALRTMGLDPMRFLVVPRVIAGLIVTPLLSLVMIVTGLLGSLIVLRGLGYSTALFEEHVLLSVGMGDYMGGLFKATVFGFEVAAIGCFEGLRTGKGASAVGHSTTAAVVAAIVVMTITDGAFAVVFYILEW